MNNFKINKFQISKTSKPFIVAEISSNHQNNLNDVFKLIREIKKSGADAVKIQTYTEDSMTINSRKKDFKITKGLWKNYTLYDLYSKAKIPMEWHKKIFDYAKKINLTCFSTPFDENAVDFLEKLNTPAYKIASFEITDLPLIEYVAKKNKPIIFSTGMANLKEIKDAFKVIKKTGNDKIIILHCVSKYPAKYYEYNLLTMKDIEKKFDAYVGLSDHTEDSITSLAATSLGAKVIEKHVKLEGDQISMDSKFSMSTAELKVFCNDIKRAWKSLGLVIYDKKKDQESLKHRRSIYVVKDIKKGEIFNKENVRKIRPAFGLLPKFYKNILGKKADRNLTKGTRFKLNFIK
jgi:pseudaminic acid synthase